MQISNRMKHENRSNSRTLALCKTLLTQVLWLDDRVLHHVKLAHSPLRLTEHFKLQKGSGWNICNFTVSHNVKSDPD